MICHAIFQRDYNLHYHYLHSHYKNKLNLRCLQCLGHNSWWGARLLISLVEFQSRNILRLCALSEIIILPFTVLLVFTYVLRTIATSQSAQHNYNWEISRRIKYSFLFTEDVPVCWLPSFITSFWSCVSRRKEIRSRVTYFTSSETDWVRCRKNRLCRISFGGWSKVCSLWPNKWRRCVNNIEIFNFFSRLSKTKIS